MTSSMEFVIEADEIVRIPARAKFEFVGHSDNEYSLKKGQSVIVTSRMDENWYVVESVDGSRSGIVPSNYLELVSGSSPKKPLKNGQARAKFDYDAGTEKEISFTKGDEIVLLEKVDENWYKGRSSNGTGIIPSVYVEVVSEPEERITKDDEGLSKFQIPQAMSKSRHSIASRQSFASTHSIASSQGDLDSPEERERKQRAAFLANSVVDSISSLHPRAKTVRLEDQIDEAQEKELSRLENGLFPSHSSASESLNPKTDSFSSTSSKQQQAGKEYRVLFDYDAGSNDELSLIPGDTIEVVEACEDGWFIGTSKQTGKFGTFPGNYVTLVNS